MSDDAKDRVVVIVVAPGARSANELVRLGYAAESAMDCDASNHAHNHRCKIEVAWAAGVDELLQVSGEAALNNEWFAAISREEHVCGAVIGPVHLEGSPILARMVEESRKRGDA